MYMLLYSSPQLLNTRYTQSKFHSRHVKTAGHVAQFPPASPNQAIAGSARLKFASALQGRTVTNEKFGCCVFPEAHSDVAAGGFDRRPVVAGGRLHGSHPAAESGAAGGGVRPGAPHPPPSAAAHQLHPGGVHLTQRHRLPHHKMPLVNQVIKNKFSPHS
jgi:hypothetical protein